MKITKFKQTLLSSGLALAMLFTSVSPALATTPAYDAQKKADSEAALSQIPMPRASTDTRYKSSSWYYGYYLNYSTPIIINLDSALPNYYMGCVYSNEANQARTSSQMIQAYDPNTNQLLLYGNSRYSANLGSGASVTSGQTGKQVWQRISSFENTDSSITTPITNAIDVTYGLEPVNTEKMMRVSTKVTNTYSTPLRIIVNNYVDTDLILLHSSMSFPPTSSSLYAQNDAVGLYMTPSGNSVIAKTPGSATINKYQFVIYFRDSPNITNATRFKGSNYSGGLNSFFYDLSPAGLDPLNGYALGTGDESITPPPNFTTSLFSSSDSAFAVWYDLGVMQPGETKEVAYGIGLTEIKTPPVLVDLTPANAVMINTAFSDEDRMHITGNWYDNDSAKVDLYGVVDAAKGGVPQKHDGGNISNNPLFSGPQMTNGAPLSMPFTADYDLSLYNDGQWHIVDYYLEDPDNLVSNQKSVRFLMYAVKPESNGFEFVGDSQRELTMLGSISQLKIPSDAEVMEVGFVYGKYNGVFRDPVTHINGTGVVSTNWDGKIGSRFSALAEYLNPIDTFRYATYVKIKFIDPLTGLDIIEYVYSDPKFLSTLQTATSTSSGGDIINYGEGESTITNGTGSNSSTDGSNNVGGLEVLGIYSDEMSMATYTPSVTPTPKPTAIEAEKVDEETREKLMPNTGDGSGVVIVVVGIIALVSGAVIIQKKKTKKH